MSEPEWELLKAVCWRGPGADDRLRAALDSSPDWDAFLTLAGLHGLLMQAGSVLRRTVPERIPGPVVDRLRQTQMEASARQMIFAANLKRIVERFASAGVDLLAFKGPVLACQLHQDACLRAYGDLDLMVKPEQASEAIGLLTELGYQSELGYDHPERAAVTRFFKELAFENPDGCPVDLHWELSTDLVPCPVNSRGVWASAVTIVVEGTPLRTMGGADLFLYTCFHGAKHAWAALAQLWEFALLLEQQKGLEFERVLARARATGCERMVLVAVELARQVLDAEAPAVIAKRTAAGDAAGLASELAKQFSPSGEGRAGNILARLMDRRRDRFRYFSGMVFAPTLAEWRAARLPVALFPLYFPFRPVRLLWKYGKRAATRRSGLR